ncbi:hypothetical protein SSS_03548 [Sarcoptes scabiei]|uniref:Uncharacterized protein n=1 Tax=Sarcoptes scabiei TaxID=52283 RepID=A0A132A2D1_SARSC|nr:hypothetical protein SSS_03548 [Sarcoptes scabiei]KPM05157.1 hypothetical protein QR98_0036160 [Sarcoptes scabiei]
MDNKYLKFLFRLVYFSIAIASWFVSYEITRIHGIYPGTIENEFIRKYVHNYYLCLINMATVWSLTAGTTICACVASMEITMRNSFWINLGFISFMLNIGWGLLFVYDWAHLI